MKKLLRRLLWVGLSLVGVLGVVILSIWIYPPVVLNTQTLTWVLNRQTALHLEPKVPQDLFFEVRGLSFNRKQIQFRSAAFCLRTNQSDLPSGDDPGLRICLDAVQFEIEFSLSRKLRPLIHRIGQMAIHLREGSLVSDAREGPSREEAKNESGGISPFIPLPAKDLGVSPLSIEVTRFEIGEGKAAKRFTAKILGIESPSRSALEFSLVARLNSTSDPQNAQAQAKFTIDRHLVIEGDVSADARTPKRRPRISARTHFKWGIKEDTLRVTGSAQAIDFIPFVPRLEIGRFEIDKSQTVKISADLVADLAIGQPKPLARSNLPQPKINQRFAAKLAANSNDAEKFTATLEIPRSQQLGIDLEASIQAQVDLVEGAFRPERVFVEASIGQFSAVVAALRRTQLAVPAPLNELQGRVKFSLGDRKELSREGQSVTIPILLETALRSDHQNFETVGKGQAVVTTSPFSAQIGFEYLLNRIKIQAPDLSPILPVPVPIKDSRITIGRDFKSGPKPESAAASKKDSGSAPSPVTLDLQIRTAGEPIRILYPLFTPSATFRTQFRLNSESKAGPSFSISFEPMQVKFMSRVATLQKLEISKDRAEDELNLKARIMMEKSGYKIYADIDQLGGKAVIDLSASPPLTTDDIISLILFGQLSSDLDTDGNGSVSDTRSAISKRALGFFSFWALSSTPVESVSYDPATNIYSAQVRLPGELRATVGSDWENSQVMGLKKSLGGKWILSTERRTSADGSSKQETMVEWYHRY